MAYLGKYNITPNVVEIEVECYGESHPAQKETLEQEPISSHHMLENVLHGDFDITPYLNITDLEYLQEKINEK